MPICATSFSNCRTATTYAFSFYVARERASAPAVT
jgi:hypothetical protein